MTFPLPPKNGSPHVTFIMDKQVIKRSMIRNLLDGNGLSATRFPQLYQELKDRFDFDQLSARSEYPHSTYLQILGYLRETLHAELSDEAAYEKLGYGAAGSFFQSSIGLIVKPLFKIFSVEQGASQFTRGMQQQFPWGTYGIEEVRAGYMRCQINYLAGPPALLQGFIRHSIELHGVKQISFRSTVRAEQDYTIEVWWK